MKLHLTQASGNQLITGCGENWVEVNDVRYERSLIVLPNLLIDDWEVQHFSDLQASDLDRLVQLHPEVILLGTGAAHRFIDPCACQNLAKHGIGVECMSTIAACRTYNILMAEGRRVGAALILENN